MGSESITDPIISACFWLIVDIMIVSILCHTNSH
ncbi:MAG: hypothetical protein ACI9H8_002569 [Lysobacterales bacterium]